jgi:hypothetical protein
MPPGAPQEKHELFPADGGGESKILSAYGNKWTTLVP